MTRQIADGCGAPGRHSRMLSECFPPVKIRMTCDKCGKRRQFDALQLYRKIGDIGLPALPGMVARAEGCQRAIAMQYRDLCGLSYEPDSLPLPPDAETQKGR